MSTKQIRRLFRSLFKLLLYAFAVVGFLDLLVRILVVPLAGEIFGYVIGLPHYVDVQQVVISPDNSMKAIAYVWSGPGLDPGCEKMVAVVDKAVPTSVAWKDSNIVYRGQCDETDGKYLAWEPPADGRVWPRLRIDADPGKADAMMRFAFDGRVAIAYRGDPHR